MRSAAGRMFVLAVLDMSWQLAIVVLIPLIGGFELDKHLHTAPVLSIVGFLLAMVGTYAVIKKMYVQYSQRGVAQVKEKK